MKLAIPVVISCGSRLEEAALSVEPLRVSLHPLRITIMAVRVPFTPQTTVSRRTRSAGTVSAWCFVEVRYRGRYIEFFATEDSDLRDRFDSRTRRDSGSLARPLPRSGRTAQDKPKSVNFGFLRAAGNASSVLPVGREPSWSRLRFWSPLTAAGRSDSARNRRGRRGHVFDKDPGVERAQAGLRCGFAQRGARPFRMRTGAGSDSQRHQGVPVCGDREFPSPYQVRSATRAGGNLCREDGLAGGSGHRPGGGIRCREAVHQRRRSGCRTRTGTEGS